MRVVPYVYIQVEIPISSPGLTARIIPTLRISKLQKMGDGQISQGLTPICCLLRYKTMISQTIQVHTFLLIASSLGSRVKHENILRWVRCSLTFL